ncbi:MFS transporter [Streptomyces sp. 2A115]|uniref:MFS transporter n=1 Tax=Streptomyces sp. 2A115 TaxID=3457439 RepID=UPI003FD3DE16
MKLESPKTQLGLIALLQVLGMAMWFSASAVVPALRDQWHIGELQAVWLTASVQLGFVMGAVTSAALNLPDRYPPQRVAALGAMGGAAVTAALPVLANDYLTAVLCRLLVGFFLAGVYPVGMKLMASWFSATGRGIALGVLVGSLTVGSALPHLVNGLGGLPWQGVLFVSAAMGTGAALLALTLIRPGPHLGQGVVRHNPGYALRMFRERGPRLAVFGYFGHMWELYAFWAWLPSFVVAGSQAGTAEAGVLAFLVIGIAGAVGCLLGGWAADRHGRAPAAIVALVVSGLCCFASPLVYGQSGAIQYTVFALWGAAVIADSGVFSTALSEVADTRYVGTALTAQTAMGFLLTTVTINLVPVMSGIFGWRYGFLVLAPGPALGALAMWHLYSGRLRGELGARQARLAHARAQDGHK